MRCDGCYYYEGEKVINNGVVYRRNSNGTTNPTFDTAEAVFWTNIGDANTALVKTITDADSPYTVLPTDGNIFIDSSAGDVDYLLDI